MVQKLRPFPEGVDFAIGGASSGEGLRLQPAQQACSMEYTSIILLQVLMMQLLQHFGRVMALNTALNYGTQFCHSITTLFTELIYGTQLQHSIMTLNYSTQLRHSIMTLD